MEFKDYYTTLGVSKTATDAEIKKAYRKLARQFHPDLNPGDKKAEARFKEINEANEVLAIPTSGRNTTNSAPTGGPTKTPSLPRGGAAVPAATARSAPGGGPQYRTMTPEEMQEMFGHDDPFSDFFHTFFGGAGGRFRTGGRAGGPRASRGQDVEQPST